MGKFTRISAKNSAMKKIVHGRWFTPKPVVTWKMGEESPMDIYISKMFDKLNL